jgi:phosphohistidine phosphatase
VIRHAKSSWDYPNLADIDRPLNERGTRDAPFMGGLLKVRGCLPDAIVCSPAVRARMTANLIAETVDHDSSGIVIEDAIYDQGLSGLIGVIDRLSDSWHRVYLIGHNPDLTLLVGYLTGDPPAHLPTCAMASIEVGVASWQHISPGSGRLVFFDYPKRHR